MIISITINVDNILILNEYDDQLRKSEEELETGFQKDKLWQTFLLF